MRRIRLRTCKARGLSQSSGCSVGQRLQLGVAILPELEEAPEFRARACLVTKPKENLALSEVNQRQVQRLVRLRQRTVPAKRFLISAKIVQNFRAEKTCVGQCRPEAIGQGVAWIKTKLLDLAQGVSRTMVLPCILSANEMRPIP